MPCNAHSSTNSASPEATDVSASAGVVVAVVAGDPRITLTEAGTIALIRRDAGWMDLDGVSVAVASLADVIRSKEAAGRPKNQAALHVLRELLREQADKGDGAAS